MSSGLPGATDPLDPSTGKCQLNFHLLSTDGYWNSALSAGSVGDTDLTVPALPLPVAGLTAGSQFPRPYYEGPTATSNSLADLAMYYWDRDIRPDKANQVKDSTAPWQHVTVYGLSIGAQGNVVYPSGIDAITAGSAIGRTSTALGAGGRRRSTTSGMRRSTAAASISTPTTPAARRKHRRCARRLHRPVGNRAPAWDSADRN